MLAATVRQAALGVASAIAGALLLVVPALAQAPPQGTFFASRACPAVQSITKGTNPGSIRIEPRQTYQVVTGNKSEPTHYLLIVPGASPERRWVAIDCGTYTAANGVSTPPHTRPVPLGDKQDAPFKTDFVFAFAWEPAFCETHADSAQCRAETGASPDAHQFSLHGLWPQPRSYCNATPAQIADDKANKWTSLPTISLPLDTRLALDAAMPGTAALLERHEWIKHGTCSKLAMPAYFAVALHILDNVNRSPVETLFNNNVGHELTLETVRDAVDLSFGPGTGARLSMSCADADGRRLITELTLGMTGNVTLSSNISTLILAAAPAKSDCTAGVVDPPGHQGRD